MAKECKECHGTGRVAKKRVIPAKTGVQVFGKTVDIPEKTKWGLAPCPVCSGREGREGLATSPLRLFYLWIKNKNPLPVNKNFPYYTGNRKLRAAPDADTS